MIGDYWIFYARCTSILVIKFMTTFKHWFHTFVQAGLIPVKTHRNLAIIMRISLCNLILQVSVCKLHTDFQSGRNWINFRDMFDQLFIVGNEGLEVLHAWQGASSFWKISLPVESFMWRSKATFSLIDLWLKVARLQNVLNRNKAPVVSIIIKNGSAFILIRISGSWKIYLVLSFIS